MKMQLHDTILDLVKKISNKSEIQMNTSFLELGMDSTNLVELLIESEILFNIDVLDNSLNLDEFQTVSDVYEYIRRLCE
jgi:acyl carrier protein